MKRMFSLIKHAGVKRTFEIGCDQAFVNIFKYIDTDVYDYIARTYYRRRYPCDTDLYDAPLDPYRIRWVSVDTISRLSARKIPSWTNIPQLLGKVSDGDWDRNKLAPIQSDYQNRYEYDYQTVDGEYFFKTIFFQSMKAHFVSNENWEDTDLYELLREGIDSNYPVYRGISSEAELKNRCEYIDDLYRNIKQNGYKTQDELHPETRLMKRRRNEILVDISREGEFLFVENRTRLAIAKLLDIDVIPVVVLVRHEDWMEHREKLFKERKSESHPDLIEFTS